MSIGIINQACLVQPVLLEDRHDDFVFFKCQRGYVSQCFCTVSERCFLLLIYIFSPLVYHAHQTSVVFLSGVQYNIISCTIFNAAST